MNRPIVRKTKEQIKELHNKNHLKKYLVYNTFYMQYKKKIRPLSDNKERECKLNDNIFFSRLRNKNATIYQDKNNKKNKLLSIYTNYNNYDPYVTKMMTYGINHTAYNKNYTKTISNLPTIQTDKDDKEGINNKKKTKKYFGIDGDTPLVEDDKFSNFGKTTLNDLYNTTSFGMKTLNTIN